MHGPSPDNPQPLEQAPSVGFLKPIVDHPQIEVGEYSYYDDPAGPQNFVERCVRYLFPFSQERLVIGRFVAIATGVEFIMDGANHVLGELSTYPFEIFGQGWERPTDALNPFAAQRRGDTTVGHDVWIGRGATIMGGVTIGSGAIVAARAVVARDVPPYATVAGNPARVVRRRFSEAEVEKLLAIAWWNWDVEKITRNLDAIRARNVEALARVS